MYKLSMQEDVNRKERKIFYLIQENDRIRFDF